MWDIRLTLANSKRIEIIGESVTATKRGSILDTASPTFYPADSSDCSRLIENQRRALAETVRR